MNFRAVQALPQTAAPTHPRALTGAQEGIWLWALHCLLRPSTIAKPPCSVPGTRQGWHKHRPVYTFSKPSPSMRCLFTPPHRNVCISDPTGKPNKLLPHFPRAFLKSYSFSMFTF